jgi:endonuclease/exonuclease/phosphatase (EEP) superfamily protein YafD
MIQRMRQLVEWAILLPVPLLAAGWLAGWLLGDRPGLVLWLYFIPAPIVLAASLAWLLISSRPLHRRLRGYMAAVVLLAALKVFAVDFRWHRARTIPPDALRVVHWNVAHTFFGVKPVLADVQADRPDLLMLSELRYNQDLPLFARRELGLDHVLQDQGMALASRFPMESQGTLPIPNGRAWWAIVQTPRGPLDVLLVDLISHPTLNRRLPAEALARWLEKRDAARPLLMVGDFNTPRDARALRPLRSHLQHAYERAGRGWPYSWPLPAPVYALDHAWVSPPVDVYAYRLRAARISDHLRQVFAIGW